MNSSALKQLFTIAVYLLSLVFSLRTADAAYIFGYIMHNPIPEDRAIAAKLQADEPSSSLQLDGDKSPSDHVYNDEAIHDSDSMLRSSDRSRSRRKQLRRLSKLHANAFPDPASSHRPKWSHNIQNHLVAAQDFIRRRASKLDEVAKFLPSAEESAAKSIKTLKQDFAKIDAVIDSFRVTVDEDLFEISRKLRQFLKEHHLESAIKEIEAEDDDLLR